MHVNFLPENLKERDQGVDRKGILKWTKKKYDKGRISWPAERLLASQ
jgi:hypothetical protein